MSVPDHLLEPDDRICRACGLYVDSMNRHGSLCWNCYMDNVDLYSDMKIQDRYEGRDE